MTTRPPRTGPSRRPSSRPGVAVIDQLRLRLSVEREADGVVRARSTARVFFVGAMVVLGYLALVAKASALMLLEDAQLETQASGQFEEAVVERGRRGDILDRDGRILATTVDLSAIHADPSLLSEDGKRRMARTFAPLVGEPEEVLYERIARPNRRDARLARGLGPDEVARMRAAVAEDLELKDALFVRRDRRRFYPGRQDAAALLGVVGQTESGQAGIERSLEEQLGGDIVKYVQWRDRKGRRITTNRPEAEPGNTVVLTIDRRIQRSTESALQDALVATGATYAHAVVVDVKTGDIVAMATVPGLNPNDQQNLDINLFKNRAALDAIEPGSVFKPFVAAAALQEGTVTTQTKLNCEGGGWTVGNKTIRDEHAIYEATLAEVIKYSSNICAAKLALELGPEKTIGYLSAFGFGRATGLGIPGETRGVLRSAKNIKRIELATTAYGYGASASAIQLAAAVAALGNDGARMRPRLVKEIRDRHGDLVARHDPERIAQVVSPEVAREIVRMMVAVTEQGGTGTKAAVPGYLVAGKTGTAKKLVDGLYSATDRVGSWVGLIPADRPALAIAVMVDSPTIGPRYGGWTAAPAFKVIAQDAMRILNIAPDPVLLAEAEAKHKTPTVQAAEGLEPEVPAAGPELLWTAEGHLRAPDLSGLSLRDALVTLQGAGLSVQWQGSGRVHSQLPAAGAVLAPGQGVAVILR